MIDIETNGPIPILSLDLGPFTVTETMLDAIGIELLELLNGFDPPLVVIDLSPTHHLNSKSIGVLIRSWQNYSARNGRIGFCNFGHYSREVLKTLHLDKHWEVYDTREEAIEALTISLAKESNDH